MPIYEYQCQTCDKRTEAIQRLDEAPLAICPHCGGALEKLLSAPSFQFKGTGWYVTDYAGKKSGGDEEGATADSSASGSSKSSSDKESSSSAKSKESGSSTKSKESAPSTKSEASGSSSTS